MSKADMLRLLVKQRVHAVVEETLELFDRLTAVYEEEVLRFRENELRSKLLEAVSIPRVQPHRSEMLRLLVKQRLHASSEETLGLIDRFTADYEEEVSRLRENEQRHKLLEAVFNPRVQIHRSDVQQLLAIKADVPPECLDLDQEDPEPLHIKDEEEDLWTRLEGEQLNVLEEADITKFLVTAVTVKSEDDKPQTSRLDKSQSEDNREAEPPASRSKTPIKTETDGEDCGGSGPARTLNPHRHSHPNADNESVFKWFPFSCDVCGNGFTRTAHLKRHMRVHTGEKLFSCDVCGKRCTRQETLNRHKRVHTGEKPFGCDVCGKRFADQRNLMSHIRVHTGEKPFGCTVCRKRFADRGAVKRHMKVHTEQKSFSCDVCGKIFTLQGNLNKHTRVHTGEKPFCCEVCGKRFAERAYVKTHMTVHTGEKLFSCDVCGKQYKRQENVKRHMRVHTREKPFRCDVCGKRFAVQGTLKKHIRVHKGDN